MTRAGRAVVVPAWVDWPGAAQVLQVRRTRIIKGRKHVEVVYAICSVPTEHATPQLVASWIQGHWGIENALHWVRDVTFDEDRHQLRVGNGPHVMAILRNTAISLLRLTGWTRIAAGLRHHAADSRRPITLLAVDPATAEQKGRKERRDDAEVYGIVVAERARAYAVGMLSYHHVINDVMAGTPVAVTY